MQAWGAEEGLRREQTAVTLRRQSHSSPMQLVSLTHAWILLLALESCLGVCDARQSSRMSAKLEVTEQPHRHAHHSDYCLLQLTRCAGVVRLRGAAEMSVDLPLGSV